MPASSSGLSDETKLWLVVAGLVLVGLVISSLTALYWRQTRPTRITTALDALADLDAGSSVRPLPPTGGADATARAPSGGATTSPAAGAAVGGGAGVAAGGRGQGVRIIGPVGAGESDSPSAVAAPDGDADPDQRPDPSSSPADQVPGPGSGRQGDDGAQGTLATPATLPSSEGSSNGPTGDEATQATEATPLAESVSDGLSIVTLDDLQRRARDAAARSEAAPSQPAPPEAPLAGGVPADGYGDGHD